jgi:hypothetical protein
MIAAIMYGLPCVLLLRWIIWETTRLFEQEWELDHICNSDLQDSRDEERVLKCLLHNGLSE